MGSFAVLGGSIPKVRIPGYDNSTWILELAKMSAVDSLFADFGRKAFLMGTGLEGKYVIKDNKKLAFGYTTGSCGAAAAKAAASMLFSGQARDTVELMTPKGILLHLTVLEAQVTPREACCAIRKDAGDDPDVTNGVLVYARVRWEEAKGLQVRITGGIGVGRVTKPGLEQPVGEAAINRVPREMITRAVTEVCEAYGYFGGMEVEISIPAGVELAKKTFNPRLGIEGGISVLGTSGIVEPMSERALLASIRLELQMVRRNGASFLLAAPGNYGMDFLSKHLPFEMEQAVKYSNFVGELFDMALELEFQGILLVSHIGKLIKVAGGIMNTHSRNADARLELLAANALRAGADQKTVLRILEAVTTEEGLAVLKEKRLLAQTMEQVLKQVLFYLEHRSYGKLQIGVVTFSSELGMLGQAGPVEELTRRMKKE